jgi:iron-sulfur cluster repair protein YtfE (RIC family)
VDAAGADDRALTDDRPGSMTDAWRTHPNADGPAGMLLEIHDHFRAVSTRLLALADGAAVHGVATLARMFVPLAETLHHHHHAEEAMMFPLIHRRTGTAPEQLIADHDEMTTAITRVEAALRARVDAEAVKSAVASFHAILIAHLDREEALVVPVLLEMTPYEAWSQINGR